MRKPAVAGAFYELDKAALEEQVRSLWPNPEPNKIRGLGAMVPHAGYIYSGKIAAQVYARLAAADIYVLLGPNHHGRGWPVALAGEYLWKTPLGAVDVDQDFSEQFMKACNFARPDEGAHAPEHALEVQLPFLQQQRQPFTIVPLLIGTWDTQLLKSIGEGLAATIQACGRRVLLVASSDMNHYEELAQTRSLDELALNAIRRRDPAELIRTVVSENISMCGVGAAAAMLYAANKLGATSAEVVAYGTSADTSGDTDRVVGYAGLIVA